MPKIILVLGLIVFLGLLVAAKVGYYPLGVTPSPTPQGVPGFKGLVFSSADDERRMRTLDGCIRNLASWQNFDDYQEFGNFYQATWGNGGNKNNSTTRAVHQIKLFTTEYKLPNVSGVGIEMNFVPDKPGWGVNFSLVNNVLESITNNRFQIIFSKYEGTSDQEIAKVIMGEGNEYQIYDTTISVSSPDSLKDGLMNYTASAQNLRDLSLKLLTDLHQEVVKKINSDTITHCLAVKRRDPLPPICIKESILNDQEKTVEFKKADEYFSTQKKMVSSDYQVMYDVLMKALPTKSCLFTGLVEGI